MKTGEKIKALRKKLKLTQLELSRLTEIGVASIQNYEYGKQNPKIEQLQKLAKALQCSPVDLLDDEANMFDKWDIQYSDTKKEYELLKQIRMIYGADSITLLEHYTALNEIGKDKANEYILDLLKLYKEGE